MKFVTELQEGMKVIRVSEPAIRGGEWFVYLDEDRPVGLMFASDSETNELFTPYPQGAGDAEVAAFRERYLRSDRSAVEAGYQVLSERLGEVHQA
jgi:hypothetical protein